jgi:hypothetical protein
MIAPERSFLQGAVAAVRFSISDQYLTSLDSMVQQKAVCYLDENVILINKAVYLQGEHPRVKTFNVILILIIIINFKNWTSLIRSFSRITTVLANVSSVFQMFSFPVVCSEMISLQL